MEAYFDIVPIIYKLLRASIEEDISIESGWYNEDIQETHVTYCELDDDINNASDDEVESISHTVQIDIWGFDDLETLKIKEKIRKIINNVDEISNVKGQNLSETLENNRTLYHKALRFDYLEVLEN